ncbi:immediate early response 3-interacting 1-like, partial [Olea europaea subsp. europaea]
EMGLWTLLEGCLLLANALAILNEDRVLAPRGWSFQEYSGVRRKSLKGQIIGLIYAAHWYLDDFSLEDSFCLAEMILGAEIHSIKCGKRCSSGEMELFYCAQ